MKIILIRNSGDPGKNDYTEAAILLEPIGGLEDYSHKMLVGSRNGVIREISEGPQKGKTYGLYDVNIAVRYQKIIYDFVMNGIGKSVARTHFWERWFRLPENVQSKRKDRGVWDLAEFIFVALNKGSYPLFNNYQPFEMSPEYLSKSPSLYFRGKVEAK